jgi:ABC-2 type transport system permease protein
MHLNRAGAITLRQFYLLRGSIARFLPLFAWVAVDIILWGFLTRYLNSVAAPGFNFVSMLLGAVLFWDFFSRVLHGVTTAFLEDIWSRNFLNFFASPLSIGEYQLGLVISSVLTSLIGLVFMLILATFVFGLSFAAYGIAVLPFLMVLFLFGIALGILGTAVVLRFGPASEWFVWPLPALVSPFVGVFYPLSTLPAWMRVVARALPPSYVFENMRAVAAGRAVSGTDLVIAVILGCVYVGVSLFIFTRVFKYGVRSGLIARYSAESVN